MMHKNSGERGNGGLIIPISDGEEMEDEDYKGNMKNDLLSSSEIESDAKIQKTAFRSGPIQNNFLGEKLPLVTTKSKFGAAQIKLFPAGDSSRSTGKKKDDRGDGVIHTADKFIVNEENPNYQLPFVFTKDEIKQAFDTLDYDKDEWVTADDIAFFLDILGEKVSEAELEEMIQMLDSTGTHRVQFEQFLRMAQGKSLSPIGIAYPPMINQLQQQNINSLMSPEVLSKIPRNDDPISFIKDQPTDKEVLEIAAQQAQLNKGGKESSVIRKQEAVQREKMIKQIIEDVKLGIGKVLESVKKKRKRDITECTLKTFCQLIGREEDDRTKRIYESLCPAGSHYIDLREFLTNAVAVNGWDNKVKAMNAFKIFDHEDSSQIFLEDMTLMFMVK